MAHHTEQPKPKFDPNAQNNDNSKETKPGPDPAMCTGCEDTQKPKSSISYNTCDIPDVLAKSRCEYEIQRNKIDLDRRKLKLTAERHDLNVRRNDAISTQEMAERNSEIWEDERQEQLELELKVRRTERWLTRAKILFYFNLSLLALALTFFISKAISAM